MESALLRIFSTCLHLVFGLVSMVSLLILSNFFS